MATGTEVTLQQLAGQISEYAAGTYWRARIDGDSLWVEPDRDDPVFVKQLRMHRARTVDVRHEVRFVPGGYELLTHSWGGHVGRATGLGVGLRYEWRFEVGREGRRLYKKAESTFRAGEGILITEAAAGALGLALVPAPRPIYERVLEVFMLMVMLGLILGFAGIILHAWLTGWR